MARLVEAASGCFLWSGTFDRQIEDLFAIQEEISRAIVDTLRIRLIGPKAERSIARHPSNLEAYKLYTSGAAFTGTNGRVKGWSGRSNISGRPWPSNRASRRDTRDLRMPSRCWPTTV